MSFAQPVIAHVKQRFEAYFALVALVAIIGYQMVLCYLFTRGFPASNAINGAVEIFILLVIFTKVARQRSLLQLSLLAFLIANFLVLWAVREAIDPFGPRDVAIMVFFFWLGQSVQDIKDANRIVWIISGIVLFFGVFEYAFTEQYLKIFDIRHFYETRLNSGPTKWAHTNLFVSATRTEGRSMFQFLGKQRVSSVFLEPVSMGNYAVIVALWGLSRDRSQWKQMLAFLCTGAIFAIASDSRFAGIMILALILFRFMPIFHHRLPVLLLPVAVIVTLLLYMAYGRPEPIMDNTAGRLARTGVAVLELDVLHLFGLAVPKGLVDEGIPFTIEMFGLVLCIVLWTWFSLLKFENPQAVRMRAMLAAYALGLLLISGTSFYSSKTASLLWFLLGALDAHITIKAVASRAATKREAAF